MTDSLEATRAARQAVWSAWGKLDDELVTHGSAPTLPSWPALRQQFRVARRENAILIASDGLSNPAEGSKANGLGLEVYAISGDSVAEIGQSWLFQVTWQAAQLCAANGRIAERLESSELLSTELYDVAIPEAHAPRFVTEHGRVAVLMGQAAADVPLRIEGPLSPIRLVSLHLLTLDELEIVLEKGPDGQRQLAQRFAAEGIAGTCTLGRPSLF